jgi:hypothetical protein
MEGREKKSEGFETACFIWRRLADLIIKSERFKENFTLFRLDPPFGRKAHLESGALSAGAEGEGIDVCPEYNRRNGLYEDNDIEPEGLVFDIVEMILKFNEGIFFEGSVALLNQPLRLRC